jgi:hypothetical protein
MIALIWINANPASGWFSRARRRRSRVPRYFFHVKRGQMTVLDQEGIELADAAQAEEEAARRAQQIVTGDALNGVLVSRGTIIVDDENWRRLFELPF